jgi:hypothetical protein
MIDLKKPDMRIDIKSLIKPYDLVTMLKKAKIKNYCYAFWVCLPSLNMIILMNLGMSVGGRIGDRIYRKVGNLPGWGNKTLNGTFGSDMLIVVEAFEEKFKEHGVSVHKDLVYVDIWDTTNLTVNSFNCSTVEAEKKLFQDCYDQFGCLPAGNFQDPRKRNVNKVDYYVFTSLFE